MMWMWQEQTGTANSHWDQTLQTKQSQLRLQLIPCCAAVEAPCWFSGSGGGGGKHVGWHRADKCVASIALNWLKPPTWFVLKGKRVLCFIAFSCRTWGQPVGGRRGSWERHKGWQSSLHPSSSGRDSSPPQWYLHNVHCLRGPLGAAFLLQRLLSPGLRSPQGADFSLFHNWARDWKKKKKQSDSQKCQVKHVYWFWAVMIASFPLERHTSRRSARCLHGWMNALAVRFLASRGQMKPGLYSSSFFLSRGSCRSQFEDLYFQTGGVWRKVAAKTRIHNFYCSHFIVFQVLCDSFAKYGYGDEENETPFWFVTRQVLQFWI